MTEKPYTPTEHERESAEAREALWQALGKPDKLYEIASALTAAEERGRRIAETEWDELRDLLWDALAVIESRAPDMTLLIPRIKAALAPRDSGKEG